MFLYSLTQEHTHPPYSDKILRQSQNISGHSAAAWLQHQDGDGQMRTDMKKSGDWTKRKSFSHNKSTAPKA